MFRSDQFEQHPVGIHQAVLLPRPIDRATRLGMDVVLLQTFQPITDRPWRLSQVPSFRPSPAPRSPRRAPGQGKKVRIVPGVPTAIAKIKVIGTGVIEVDSPLDEPQSKQADVEVDIALRITGDCRHMMKPGGCFGESVGWRARNVGNPFKQVSRHRGGSRNGVRGVSADRRTWAR